jgi:hypothetical protein
VVVKSLTAGTFAGMAQVFIGHPLDTVKVITQVNKFIAWFKRKINFENSNIKKLMLGTLQIDDYTSDNIAIII